MSFINLTATVDANPAGGAAVWEAALATGAAIALTLGVFALGWAHRTGRITFIGAFADRVSAVSGLPRWAALPSAITGGSLLVAFVGMYWDISLHIADGRDPGPFANPAHFLILAGLFGVFIAGFLAVVLPEGRPSRASVRIKGDWYAPIGGIGLLAASAFALTGFPLDDFWHRIFGQDVTLWGPTHMMMIGGAALAFIGQATLLGEAKPLEREPERAPGIRGRIAVGVAHAIDRSRGPALAGGFLIGLSTFQAEFDFGVPQFRMLFAPVLIAFAAGAALTAARIYGGRGGALGAALFFIALRGGLALLVGPVLGEPTPHLPLYLAEALLVEGAAFAIAPRLRPYAFGALAGTLIGTVGFAAEYAWSHVWMPIPWSQALIGEALVPTVIVAIAAGVLGAFIATSWRAPLADGTAVRLSPLPAAAALVAIVAVIGFGLQSSTQPGVSANVKLADVPGPGGRQVEATVRLDPADAAADADWLTATAWQGHGFQVDPLEQIGPGIYRTTAPLPVYGSWKALIRLHSGDSIAGIPIYLPRDSAIPAAGVAAKPQFTREFVADSQILQREKLDGVPTWTKAAGYGVVGSIVLALLMLLGWSLNRLGRVYGPPGEPRRRRPKRAPAAVARKAAGGRA